MAITFKNYPISNRVPGFYAEVNNANANTATVAQNALLIGPMLSTGAATATMPVMVSGADPDALFGAGSVLSLMCKQYVASDPYGTLYALPVSDAGAAVKASATLTIAGTATASGVVSLYVAGTLVSTAVSLGDTATVIAANIVTAITGTANMPVTATSTAGAITLTARNGGLVGNDIDLRLNYLGAAGGQSLPSGITATFSGGTASAAGYLLGSGATNPTLTAALANMPTTNFDFIGLAFSDTASLTALNTFLSDSTGRWSWEQELFGHYFTATRGTLATLATFGTALNAQHGTVMGIYDAPDPGWIWAAELAAQVAVSVRANPALPLQNIVLNLMAPTAPYRFDIGDRNTLLYDGISTFKVSGAGEVILDRTITTYQKNTSGLPDNSYLDAETMFQLAAYIRDARTFLSSRYSRSILVADGTSIPYGSAMVTAQTIRASLIGRYRSLADQGLVQNPDVFAAQAVAENRGGGVVALELPVQLANQLRVVAMLISFTKP